MARRRKNADATAKILLLILAIPVLPVVALGYGVWLAYRYVRNKKVAARQKASDQYLSDYELREKFGAEYDLHSALLAYTAPSPLFSGNDVVWIAPYVQLALEGGKAANQIARMLRAEGPPLSVDLKKSFGYRANFRIGERFFNILSSEGKSDPVYASEHILNWCMNNHFNFIQRKIIEYRKRPARFSAIDDGNTCDQAVQLHGHIFEHSELPNLPLPNCDAEQCRCHIRLHYGD
jgi:hypothetical protein